MCASFRPPEWRNARTTLTVMGVLVAVMFLGLSYLAGVVGATPSVLVMGLFILAFHLFCARWEPAAPGHYYGIKSFLTQPRAIPLLERIVVEQPQRLAAISAELGLRKQEERELSRALRDEQFVAKLRGAGSEDAMFVLLARDEATFRTDVRTAGDLAFRQLFL